MLALKTRKNPLFGEDSSRELPLLNQSQFIEARKAFGMTKHHKWVGWDSRAMHLFADGFYGKEVIPPRDSSPYQIQVWRKILPRAVCSELEFLFPLFQPGHEVNKIKH